MKLIGFTALVIVLREDWVPVVELCLVLLRYRIMDEGTKTGSDELKAVFETHLAEAGQMFFGSKQTDKLALSENGVYRTPYTQKQ